MRSNCLLWACQQWWKRGGYLALRRSRYGWWWHFFWSPDMTHWYSFSPVDPRHKACPPPLFRGEVKEGDGEQIMAGH